MLNAISTHVYLKGRLHPGLLDGLVRGGRSEEHTSELQSQSNLVCRLLLAKKRYNCRSYCISQPRLAPITPTRRLSWLLNDLSARLLPSPLQVAPLTLEDQPLTLDVTVTAP